METTVRDVMTASVVTVTRNTTPADAERTLLLGRLSELFVVDEEGFVIGVLPDYAFLKLHLSDAERPKDIASLMSRRFFVIGPDSSLSVAVRYLRDYLHHRLAVVENRRLIGILTRTNVLEHLSTSAAPDEAAA